MIYLFNSGLRNEYSVNVLNTLHLPVGMDNQYRYSSYTGYDHVDNALTTGDHSDKDVLIIFIDRYVENGFKYYPLRKGKLICSERIESKIYFTVKLLEYYAVEDIDSFNIAFSKEFAGRVPVMAQSNVPEDQGPGFFAFEGRDICTSFKVSSYSPWFTNIQRLSKAKIFAEAFTIFTRVDIQKSNKKSAKIKKIEGADRIHLEVKETYKVKYHYYFEIQEKEKDSYVEIELIEKSRSFSTSKPTQTIRNKTGYFTYELSTNKSPEQKYEDLEFRLNKSSLAENQRLYIADSPIKIQIRNSIWFWAEIAAYVLLIGLGRWLLDLNTADIIKDLSGNVPLSGYQQFLLNISTFLNDYKYTNGIVINALNAFLTFIIFLRFGKKVI